MSSEQRGFVFGVTFIVIFGVLLATIPAGLQGPEETPEMLTPLDPSIITDFSVTSDDFVKSDFTSNSHMYTLGGRDWICQTYSGYLFAFGAKVLIGGVLWLGQIDSCKFISPTGEDRGGYLAIDEIDEDDNNGTVRYSLYSIGSGNAAGGFVIYWNTTAYTDPIDAWNADKLYLLHGLGFGESATANIGALLVGLLFLQLPDVPLLVNILLVTPIWASIIFILWFLIKEMVPFV